MEFEKSQLLNYFSYNGISLSLTILTWGERFFRHLLKFLRVFFFFNELNEFKKYSLDSFVQKNLLIVVRINFLEIELFMQVKIETISFLPVLVYS